MTASVILLILGILSVTVELFVPGFGIFGIGGFAAIAASFGFCFEAMGIGAVIAELIIALAVFCLIFAYVKKYKLHGKIILEDNVKQDSTNKENYYKTFIGKTGISKTPLRPCGNVKFDSQILEVFSERDFIAAEKEVKATKVYDNKLYVELKED